MKVGLVLDGTDHFIKPIEAELRRRHQVERFTPQFLRLPLIGQRVNERLLDRQLQSFIHRHDVTFFEWAASLLVRASHLSRQGRIVARLHSVELATAVEQVNWHHVNHLIVLNQTVQRRLFQLVSDPLPQTTIIANGVNILAFQPANRSFAYRLGMACNLLPVKRIYEVVLTVFQLRREGHPFTLRIAGRAGEGEARRYAWALESVVARLDLSEAVVFSDFVTDISTWFHNVDVFISNSYWEGQQMGLIEAMASGCYCLSHCWDGVEEILPGENIFVTDSELRDKLVTYAGLAESARQHAQAQMRAIVEERFDEQRMVKDIINVIQAML